MIARSTQTAALALMAVTLLGGWALPQDAQARDGHSRSYGYQHDRRDRDYDDGPRYDSPRYYDGGHHRHHRHYAPRYYPDVVIYQEAPRVYYPAPYYYGPVEYAYPREYGTVGLHLDYNLRF